MSLEVAPNHVSSVLTVESAHDRIVGASKRLRIFFHLVIGCFVLISSFLFGLTSGLGNKLSALPITSGTLQTVDNLDESTQPEFQHIALPHDVRFIPMGKDITINGKTAEVAMFHSQRGVKELITEVVTSWQRQGLQASGMTGKQRGVGLGVDKLTGARYTITVWKTPPQHQQFLGGMALTQGMMAYASPEYGIAAESQAMPGEVPSVPVMPGGSGGSVFSSVDRGGRTYTGTYTNPGSVRESIDFYLSTLQQSGWRVAQDDATRSGSFGFGSLQFERGDEQTVLLFSPLPKTAKTELRTLVTVVNGPKSLIRGQG